MGSDCFSSWSLHTIYSFFNINLHVFYYYVDNNSLYELQITISSLFPFGRCAFLVNRPRTVSSMADRADHILWYENGRFAHHHYFKFVVHNMIMRRRDIYNSNCCTLHYTHLGRSASLLESLNSIGRKNAF